MKRYNENFENDSDIEREFALAANHLRDNNLEVLYAIYTTGDYDGDSFLVLRNTVTKELFEVNASHCSCYGLEGQFEPERTTLESLKLRKDYSGTPFLKIAEFVEGLK